MAFVCPLPPLKVYVRAEYLYDHREHHGELIHGIWCSVKAIRGQAFRFETYLPTFGALYDKLPVSAFLATEIKQPGAEPLLDLDVLEIWDALAYDVTVIDKPLIKGLRAEFYGKDGRLHAGEYLFTLDTCSPDPRIPDFTFSETAEDHKSYNEPHRSGAGRDEESSGASCAPSECLRNQTTQQEPHQAVYCGGNG